MVENLLYLALDVARENGDESAIDTALAELGDHLVASARYSHAEQHLLELAERLESRAPAPVELRATYESLIRIYDTWHFADPTAGP